MNFKGEYLRVLTPLTTDGVSPLTENDKIVFREDHLPMTAKKNLEAKNINLPNHLKKKIEVVSNTYTPQPKPVTSDTTDTGTVIKNKGGRPKK